MNQTIEIEKIISSGLGLARFKGQSVFIPFVLPGEKVEYIPVKEKKDYIIGRVSRIIEPSPLRVEPFCPSFGLCGGCQYQMMAYDKEIEIKREVILESFKRIAQVSLDPDFEIVPSLKEKNYRNRITLYRTQSGMWAYRKGESHESVKVNTCPLAEEEINKKLARYSPYKTGDYIFRADYMGKVHVYTRGRKSQRQKKYREKTAGITLSLSGEAFFQVNRTLIPQWLDSIRKFITEQGCSGPVLELYSGSGLISL